LKIAIHRLDIGGGSVRQIWSIAQSACPNSPIPEDTNPQHSVRCETAAARQAQLHLRDSLAAGPPWSALDHWRHFLEMRLISPADNEEIGS
jgi:hypothetical protein